jgi:sulfide:quinone oxidoreductase
MKRHVLILGAGFGGLELATRLSEVASDAVDVTLLDRNDSFFFGFSKLEVMLGRQSADAVRLPYRDIAKDGVEFRQETVVGIDPVARRVQTDVGSHDADFLVVAMGADYDMAATPGFEVDGYEYYSLAGAERLRDALSEFPADACSSRCSGSRSSVRRRRLRGRSSYTSCLRNGEFVRPWRWRRRSRCSAPCR